MRLYIASPSVWQSISQPMRRLSWRSGFNQNRKFFCVRMDPGAVPPHPGPRLGRLHQVRPAQVRALLLRPSSALILRPVGARAGGAAAESRCRRRSCFATRGCAPRGLEPRHALTASAGFAFASGTPGRPFLSTGYSRHQCGTSSRKSFGLAHVDEHLDQSRRRHPARGSLAAS